MRSFAATVFGILLCSTLAVGVYALVLAAEISGQEDTGWGYVYGSIYLQILTVALVPLVVLTLLSWRWYRRRRRADIARSAEGR